MRLAAAASKVKLQTILKMSDLQVVTSQGRSLANSHSVPIASLRRSFVYFDEARGPGQVGLSAMLQVQKTDLTSLDQPRLLCQREGQVARTLAEASRSSPLRGMGRASGGGAGSD